MEYYGASNEYLLVSSSKDSEDEVVDKHSDDTLSIYWNREKSTTLIIDSVSYTLNPCQMVFLTEFHNVVISKVEEVNIIRFNRNFYCIDNHDSEIGCKGILFFGASQVPIINLNEENTKKFELLWGVFLSEFANKDEMQIEMLQMLLKRFLILATRIFKIENKIVAIQETKMDVIRNFCFLVEVHFKTKHTVSQYADMMHKPAKSLTNLFANHIKKTPLQIIQDRIFIEAKRILTHSEKSIKETAFELGFEDIQSFSRFFKNKNGASPKEFRENIKAQPKM